MIRRAFMLMALTLALVHASFAQAAPQPGSLSPACAGYRAKISSYRQFAERWIARDKIPGVTVGFSKGACVWVEGFGYADVENAVPATAQSTYRYASIQKSMTAVAVLQLVEAGKLDLDAPIQRYVPIFHPSHTRSRRGNCSGTLVALRITPIRSARRT